MKPRYKSRRHFSLFTASKFSWRRVLRPTWNTLHFWHVILQGWSAVGTYTIKEELTDLWRDQGKPERLRNERSATEELGFRKEVKPSTSWGLRPWRINTSFMAGSCFINLHHNYSAKATPAQIQRTARVRLVQGLFGIAHNFRVDGHQ